MWLSGKIGFLKSYLQKFRGKKRANKENEYVNE